MSWDVKLHYCIPPFQVESTQGHIQIPEVTTVRSTCIISIGIMGGVSLGGYCMATSKVLDSPFPVSVLSVCWGTKLPTSHPPLYRQRQTAITSVHG